ncbi:oleate hydratase [Clostridium sp. Marseille-Q7071]
MEKFSGNKAGTGALVTFKDSNCLMSIVLAHQPHFINQSECNDEDILTELCSYLKFNKHLPLILEASKCISCMMPFITSQFMPRTKSDRPKVVPKGSTNLAFLGQYCDIPNDVVFTVEYLVRSAQTTVYSLLKLNKDVTSINPNQYDIRTLFNSFITSFR